MTSRTASSSSRADPHRDISGVRGVLHGIDHQIAEHLAQPRLVAEHLWNPRPVNHIQRDRALRRDRAGVMHGVGGQCQQVHPVALQRALGVQPCQQQQIFDQQAHPARFTLDPRHRLLHVAGRPLPIQLGESTNGGQRGAQLMAGVGDEPRIRSSELRANSADDSDDATAAWICASIPFSANDNRPTSVRGSRSGTRRSS